MEVIVLWMVIEWDNRVKALQGLWSVQFTDTWMCMKSLTMMEPNNALGEKAQPKKMQCLL